MKIKYTRYASCIFIVVLAFWLSAKWYNFKYTDTCLNAGGGVNPGGYPICVIERVVIDKNPTRTDGIYFCDGVGNKFISEDEARAHGLKDSEFGATFCTTY